MDSTVADEIFRIVPADDMPPGHDVIHIDRVGQSPIWLIRHNAPLPVVIAEINRITTHLIQHGIWREQRDDVAPPRLRHVS
jgi:hypothetical protein